MAVSDYRDGREGCGGGGGGGAIAVSGVKEALQFLQMSAQLVCAMVIMGYSELGAVTSAPT